MTYRLHYAPDNASMIVRLCLEQAGLPYEAALVDRATRAQDSAAYRALNPNGLIPVLETPNGALFETGAICLWLADRHAGLAPLPDDAARGDFLKWLFFVSNTLHPSLRMLFYPEKYLPDPNAAGTLRAGLQGHLAGSLATLEALAETPPSWLGGPTPTVLDFYLVACLRWCALYPRGTDLTWFTLMKIPNLRHLCRKIEGLPAAARVQEAEGLGPTPFSNPRYATPKIGSAT